MTKESKQDVTLEDFLQEFRSAWVKDKHDIFGNGGVDDLICSDIDDVIVYLRESLKQLLSEQKAEMEKEFEQKILDIADKVAQHNLVVNDDWTKYNWGEITFDEFRVLLEQHALKFEELFGINEIASKLLIDKSNG